MTRPHIVKRSGVAAVVSCLCWAAVMLVAPVARATPLSNGLEIGCFVDNPNNRVKCVTLPSCPRVHGDYVVDALHTMINGVQQEYTYRCIQGETASWILPIDVNTTFTFGVQACRKKTLEGDWCTPYSNYTYTPAPPVQCPAGSPTRTVPAGQKCAPVPDVVLPVTPGEPLGSGSAPPPKKPPGRTVISDVQLYDVAGGEGNVIGELEAGDAVTVDGPCPFQNAFDPAKNGWCLITDTTKGLTGAVWGEAISK